MENNSRIDQQNRYDDDSFLSRVGRNKVFTVVIVALILFAALWIIKDFQIRKVRREALAERQSLVGEAQAEVRKSEEQQLRLFAKPYVWSLRNELLRGNINQVDLYANEMISEKNFQRIVVADNSGKVVSSTDQKLVGNPYNNMGGVDMLAGDSTIVNRVNDSLLLMSSPIMGFNSRLGTLIVSYRSRIPAFSVGKDPDSE